MALPSNADLPNYPFPAVARTYDFEFLRLMSLCWAGGEGIAPIDQTKDCTISGMGLNQATDLLVSVTSGLTLGAAAGCAWVKGDDRSTQGIYFCYVPASQAVTLDTHHATLPRVDRVVLRVYDADVSGAQTKWAVEKISGTPTSGATLANLNGAAAVPNGCFLIANALVPATSGAVTLTDTRFFAYRPGRRIGFIQNTTSDSQAWSGAGYSPGTILTLTTTCNNEYMTKLGIGGAWFDGNGGAGTDIAVVGRWSAGGADHVSVQATLAANNYKHGFPTNIGKPRTWSGQRSYAMHSYKSAAGSASVNVGAGTEVPIQMWVEYV